MGGVENVGVELLAGSLLHGEDALRDDEKGLVGDGLVRRLRHVLECAENELVGVGGARGELVVVVILLMCIISGMSLVGMTGMSFVGMIGMSIVGMIGMSIVGMTGMSFVGMIGILVNCTIVLVHVTITLRNRTITLMNTLILLLLLNPILQHSFQRTLQCRFRIRLRIRFRIRLLDFLRR